MEDGKNRFYGFGKFRVDTRRRILSKNGETISLSPRNFDLLLVMIENEGQILSHDDLLDKVWEGTFVEQANLKNAISVLRRVLGEVPNEALYIRTVPRRGYSFVAPVEVLPDEHAAETLLYEETVSEFTIEEEVESEDENRGTFIREASKTLSMPTVPAPWRVNKLFAMASVLVILAAAGYGVLRWRANSSPRLSIDNIKITKLTNKGNVHGAIVSPSGNYFLYALIESDGASLWAQQIATGSATRLTPQMKASFWYFTFSPDDNYVYYTVNNDANAAKNGYFKVPLFGGSPQRLSDNKNGFVPSPDASRILFPRSIEGGTQYVAANPDYSDEKIVAAFGLESRLWSVQWSPDGSGVLFAVRKFVGEKTLHYVVEFPAGGGEGRVIVPEMEKQITSAVWLAGKTGVLLSLREINGEIRQLWEYTLGSGELQRVTNDDNSYRGLSISRDGKTVVTTTDNIFASAMTSDDDKYNFKQITSGTARLGTIGAVADGRLLVSGTTNGIEAISIMDADGANARQITAGNDGIWLSPRVSSNGRSVVFASLRSNRKQLCRVDLDGRSFTQLTNFDSDVFKGHVLGDDKTVIFEAVGPDHVDSLYRQSGDGSITRLIVADVDAWDVSPDEKYIAYQATDPVTRQSRVFVTSADTGWLYKMLDIKPVGILRWTRDSRSLTYDAVNGESTELRSIPFHGGEPKVLASFQGDQIFSFDWFFDGKSLAIIRGKPLTDAVKITIGN